MRAETWPPYAVRLNGGLLRGTWNHLLGSRRGIFPATAESLEQVGRGDVVAQPGLHQAVLRLQQRALAVEQGQQVLGTGLVAESCQSVGFLRLLGGGFQG